MRGSRHIEIASGGWKTLLILMLCSVMLSACGGDSGDSASGDVPVPDGVEELDSAEISEEDMGTFGAEVSDGETIAYSTDMSLSEVEAFYGGDLDDDWTVATSEAVGNTVIAVLSGGDRVATIVATTGSAAKANTEITSGNDLEINFDELEDEDTLILVAQLTCEGDIASCIAAFQPQ